MVGLSAVTLHGYLYHIFDFTVTQASFPLPAHLAHTGVSDQRELPSKRFFKLSLEAPVFKSI